jgi:5-methylcytosine-specific restriction endonuclease McrA
MTKGCYKRRAKRVYIFTRDKFACRECGWQSDRVAALETLPVQGVRRLTIEHIVERGMGGTSHYSNLITLCNECNRKKSEQFGKVKTLLMNTMRIPEDETVELLKRWFDPDLIMWATCV